MELNGKTDDSPETDIKSTICQHCGSTISTEKGVAGNNSDYVVHRIPGHGEDTIHSVFYCGPSCFNNAMDDLFSDRVGK